VVNILPGGLRLARHSLAHSYIISFAAVHSDTGGLAAGLRELAILHLPGFKWAVTTGTPGAGISLLLGHFLVTPCLIRWLIYRKIFIMTFVLTPKSHENPNNEASGTYKSQANS
jgi:hypothetical protein